MIYKYKKYFDSLFFLLSFVEKYKIMKVKITEDSESEMLKIETDMCCLFEGNYRNFSRCGKSFKEMLEK